jgi:hypothetical protein
MGMFDYLTVRIPIKNKPYSVEGTYQTKSFDNTLTHYVIREDKRIYELIRKYEEVPEELRPNYGKPEWDDENALKRFMARNEGSFIITDEKWVDMNYHGIIEFHDIGTDEVYYSFMAKFTDGICVECKLND